MGRRHPRSNGFPLGSRPAGRWARASAIVILVLALEVAAWSAFGAFSKEEPGRAVPSEFGATARPFVGDRGEYSVSTIQGSHETVAEHSFLQFQWLSPQPMLDSRGVLHVANRLWTTSSSASPFIDEARVGRPSPLEFTFWYDEEGLLFARSERNATSETWQTGFPHLTNHTQTMDSIRTVFFDTEFAAPAEPCCGLLNLLQGEGEPLASGGSVNLFRDGPWATRSFHPLQIDTVAERASVHWESDHSGPRIRAWTTPAVPYPLRIEVDRDGAPGTYDVVRLSRFERGDGPLREGSGRVGPPPPRLELRPVRPWGPDDDGVKHPWSLSEAYEYALTDHSYPDVSLPQLREFLHDHPHAVTQAAFYSQGARSTGYDYGWNIVVGDGDAGFSFFSVLETETAGELTAETSPVGGMAPVARHREAYADNEPLMQRLVPPDRAPTAVPTVASLLSRWQLHRAATDASLEGNYWSYQLRCADPSCSRVDAVMGAGALTTTGPLDSDGLSRVASRVTWGGGEAVRETFTRVQRDSGVIRHTTVIRAPPPASASPASVVAGLSAFHPFVLAAIGTTAVLAGVAYATWSALRSWGALPFFSRLEPQAGMQHPARRRLRDEIERNPGLHFRALVRRTGLTRAAAAHHLRKLVEFQTVRVVDGNGYLCYFPVGRLGNSLIKASPFLKSEGARRILGAIAARPGTSGFFVAHAAGLDPATVHFHLKRLQQVGLIDVDRSGKALKLTLTALGRDACCLASKTEPGGAPDAA